MAKCVPVVMKDGTTVLAMMKPGETLTEEDKRIISEYVQFCRDQNRRAKERKRRAAAR